MNEKKSFIFTIALTAICASLLTNAARDVISEKNGGEGLQKISVVKKMLTEYSLFDTDEKKMSDYASMAMAASIDDPYTNYYTAEEFSSYRDNLVSSYVGIGAVIGADTKNDRLVIISCYEDSPADKAGLKSGDVILEIDGKEYKSAQLSDASMYIKSGEAGTNVLIKVKRDGEEIDINVERGSVLKQSVKSEMLDDKTGYIRITGFESKGNGEKDTYDEFCDNLSALQSAGMERMIIDLRDNPGGDLNVVCNIADKLLGEGIITYTEDKYGKRDVINSDKNEIDLPIAVLVNGGSASASEVLTGALKDHKKATVVGEKTFGKGIVQTVYPFSDGSGISITTAKYYTPSGTCIHGIGIEPDVMVKQTENSGTVKHSEDAQLKAALEVIGG